MMIKDHVDRTLHIFLDDIRNPLGPGWTILRTAEEVYKAICIGENEDRDMVVSLDHDLGEDVPTGYDLLNWIEWAIASDENFRPKVSFIIHSANPVGCDNMKRAIKAIERMMS